MTPLSIYLVTAVTVAEVAAVFLPTWLDVLRWLLELHTVVTQLGFSCSDRLENCRFVICGSASIFAKYNLC